MQGTTINVFPNIASEQLMGGKPEVWFGTDTLDGTASPWKDVAPGSIYLYMSGATPKLWQKDALNDATADWGFLAFTT